MRGKKLFLLYHIQFPVWAFTSLLMYTHVHVKKYVRGQEENHYWSHIRWWLRMAKITIVKNKNMIHGLGGWLLGFCGGFGIF